MLKRLFYIPLLSLLLTSCYTPENLRDFDSETWKADRFACNGKRSELVQEFEKIRQNLYGQKEYVARNLLGKPDQEELLEGNQRIYYYYLEKGEQCTDRSKLSDANWAEVRINAVGKVSEISYKYPIKTAKPG
ncbi:hypothetical protein [Pontibacter liquoris]|uniref:hypothetical protein n=1 Tax=Pontibacter liquoris TaxID=2905677 RepID=UPI001FA7E72C|nr:hypothetical protein [Pontibacter liquoris]